MNEEYIKFFGNIQIVRNVKKYPFVPSMTSDEKKALTQTVLSVIQNGGYKCRLLDSGLLLSNREYFSLLYSIPVSPKDDQPLLHIASEKTLDVDIYIVMCREDHLRFSVCLSRTQRFEDIYPQVAKVVQISLIRQSLANQLHNLRHLRINVLEPLSA